MPRPAGLACVRCGAAYRVTRYAFDCDRCRGEAPANLTVTYADGALAGIRREAVAAGPPTRWRWAPFLPVEAHDAVSLGEGGTPLVLAERLGAEHGGAALDQGRVAQPDLVVQGPARIGGDLRGPPARRAGDRLVVFRQRRRRGRASPFDAVRELALF